MFSRSQKLAAGIKILGFALLLPVGAVLLGWLSFLKGSRYDDSGFGSFYGLVWARLSCATADRFFFVSLDGQSTPHWCWIRPTNYHYNVLNFEWRGETSEGKGQIDVSSMRLSTMEGAVALSQSSLAEMLFGTSTNALNKEEVQAVTYIRTFITDAGKGRLPPPKHHSYTLEKPVAGSFRHFSLGSRFGYSVYGWAAGWTVCCLWMCLRGCARTKSRGG